ncbi:MAG: MBL fold metallo-hydrolase [Flavobacteriales bacterium]|nr:MBL fold metallo-hydrolase [Flavobacteriales bacterium]
MRWFIFIFVLVFISCKEEKAETIVDIPEPNVVKTGWGLSVLGVAQDAGYPQAGCDKECCRRAVRNGLTVFPTSLAIINHDSGKFWLIEATPDIKYQLNMANDELESEDILMPEKIFITHAHIGHYAGLMHFGKEVMGSKNQAISCMPKMAAFLSSNGPWNQLLESSNIVLDTLENGRRDSVFLGFNVTPMLVPHRDEYSETVGFLFEVDNTSIVFIPDIDKWEKWPVKLDSLLRVVDIAFIDGTFYNGSELPERNLEEIPHPFVFETMAQLDSLDEGLKRKVHFIHFNHTNPLIQDHAIRREVEDNGYKVTKQGDYFSLGRN